MLSIKLSRKRKSVTDDHQKILLARQWVGLNKGFYNLSDYLSRIVFKLTTRRIIAMLPDNEAMEETNNIDYF